MVRSTRAGLVSSLALALWLSAAALAQEAVPIAPGASYSHIYRPQGPWAIHIVAADLSQQYVALHSLLGGGATMGRRPLAEIVSAAGGEDHRPVAAVNGDFFSLAGGEYATVPLGLHIVEGELITLPDPARSALYLLADGTADIGRFRANAWLWGPGDLLYRIAGMNRPPGWAELVVFSPRFGAETSAEEGATQYALVGLSGPLKPNAELTATIATISGAGRQRIPPDGAVLAARGVAAYALRRLRVGDEVRLRLAFERVDAPQPEVGEIREAVGGGPRLVRSGVVSIEHLEERFSEQFAARRHPRTGVGVRDGTLVMVTVDGRQPGYTEGMTLPELAEVFLELGCAEAMNLDGGGSTTMVVRDRVVNSPSGGTPRAVVNALALFSTAPPGPPAHLSIEPAQISVLAGERGVLRVRALDEYYAPVAVRREDVVWQCSSALGVMDESGVFSAAPTSAPTTGLVLARCGDLTGSCVVRVLPEPSRVVVTPEEVVLAPGGAQQFFVHAYDEQGHPIQLPPGRAAWSCEPGDDASVSESGVLQAPAHPCRLTLRARVAEVSGQAVVTVGAAPARAPAPAPALDFEQEGRWSYRARPASVPGGVEWRHDPVQTGNRCLCLLYDFSTMAGTRTAHAELNAPLPDAPALTLRVLGDGKGAWLRARLHDGAGRTVVLDLANRVSWSGEWRQITVPLPSGIAPPVTLESIYLAEYRDAVKVSGEILLDDIGPAPFPGAAE